MTIENSVGELVPTLAQPFWVYLARLNRKERYWLLRDALGEGSARLSSNFTAKFDPKWRPSPDAWWGMDYHFDWMVAALWAAGRDAGSLSDTHKPAFAKRISGNQEDVDLLIADGRRVWLCEAKFAGALSRKQIDSKKARYDALVELSALTELRIEFVEVDALPAGRHERRSSTDMVKELNVELNIHAGVEFARVTRTKMNGTECSDFEIVPVKI